MKEHLPKSETQSISNVHTHTHTHTHIHTYIYIYIYIYNVSIYFHDEWTTINVGKKPFHLNFLVLELLSQTLCFRNRNCCTTDAFIVYFLGVSQLMTCYLQKKQVRTISMNPRVNG